MGWIGRKAPLDATVLMQFHRQALMPMLSLNFDELTMSSQLENRRLDTPGFANTHLRCDLDDPRFTKPWHLSREKPEVLDDLAPPSTSPRSVQQRRRRS